MSKIVELTASELAMVTGGDNIQSAIRIITVGDLRDVLTPPYGPTGDGSLSN